jgi:hypothetical protein
LYKLCLASNDDKAVNIEKFSEKSTAGEYIYFIENKKDISFEKIKPELIELDYFRALRNLYAHNYTYDFKYNINDKDIKKNVRSIKNIKGIEIIEDNKFLSISYKDTSIANRLKELIYIILKEIYFI